MAESSSEDSRIPEETKKSVRAVLLSKIGGVPLDRFASDFKKLAGYPLHYKELGFSSLRDVLDAMPNVVRFNYSDEASKWMLYGIGDPNSYMSSAAKKAQFSKPGDGTKETPRKRNRNKFRKSNSAQGDTRNSPVIHQRRSKQTTKADVIKGDGSNYNKGDKSENTSPRLNMEEEGELRVPRSSRGFYSVCVHHKGGPGDSKHKIMQEICELFATQGDVIEKACVKSLMFFRFLTEDEAVSVIKLYNGRCLSDGNEIRVTPASEKMPSRKKSAELFEGKPSRNKQREQQQHMLQQVHLQQQHHQQEQQLLAQHQMLEQYGMHPEAYHYLQACAGVQEAYFGMPEEQVFDGHPDYNGFDEGHEPASVVEICVFNLNKAITKEDLLSLFWQFNPLHVRLRSKQGDRNTRKHFAFVAFACLADAHNAEANLQNTMVKGCHVNMEMAKTKPHQQRSPEEQAQLKKAKELNNQKLRSESRGPPQSCRSEEDSTDSISDEILVSDNPDGDPYMHNKVPVINDSFYALKTHHVIDDTCTLSSAGSEGSPVPSLQKGGVSFGRGRGSLMGHLSPSLGRGLTLHNAGTEKKKKLRPSLADLADKLHEL